jgi:hypothetical protein
MDTSRGFSGNASPTGVRWLLKAVQLNFEAPTQLLGNVDVLAIRSKQYITPVGCITILSQLDGMPPVGLLEAREANARGMVLFGSKEAFEGFCSHTFSYIKHERTKVNN